jgi:plastocyanin
MKTQPTASDIRRLIFAILTGTALFFGGVAGARAATVQIDGIAQGGMLKWVVGTNPATDLAVNPGDTVIWRAVSGKHGVVFTTQALAEGVLQFETVGGLPALGPQTVQGEMVWGTAPQDAAGMGTVLARATVKAGLTPGTKLTFFCSQHGHMMNGSLAVPAAPVSKTIQIDGIAQMGMVKWVIGNDSAADVAVNPGDKIVWRAVTGKHGVVFDKEDVAKAFLTFDTDSNLPALGPQTVKTEMVWGTAPQDAAGMGTVLARATVKTGLSPGSKLGFFCSQHGRMMSGALELPPAPNPKIVRTIKAEVVALDQCFMVNRLGASMPQGMIFALKRDVVSVDGTTPDKLEPGKVRLRPGRRPRPLVLRMNVGDCLEITFTNLLAPTPASPDGVHTRSAGVHVMGMQLVGGTESDGSWVGKNNNSLAESGETRIYKIFAQAEGAFLLYSTGADFGDGNKAGQLSAGLFGSVTVHPRNAEWYRSQVTRADLDLVTEGKTVGGAARRTINYDKLYPQGARYPDGRPIPTRTPILKMLNEDNEIVYSDLTAVITGPKHGCFPERTFPKNPAYPHRDQPYREITIHYHDALNTVQAFAPFADSLDNKDPRENVLVPGRDNFAINYGVAGIGAEVWANRLGVGPMHNSPETRFEEFFLSSWVVGDPAMVVDVPANVPAVPDSPEKDRPLCLTDTPTQDPKTGPKATKAFYPEDPSNVYHSYLHDRVLFRILHAGGNITHVHHQHAHQWLRTPESDNSTLLDSQTITPGDAYTLEMIYGSGNRNMTPGDSIFHCHFYPHFAAGMWALWRVHDVYEAGTKLDKNGRPLDGARALPDGEIAKGTPIPGLVPLPTLAMAPDPADVKLVAAKDPLGNPTGGYKAELADPKDTSNPGYPFFVPGVGGRRAPHPPLDFALDANGNPLDGGLPRHLILNGKVEYVQNNQRDFTRESGDLVAVQLPEEGTPVEKLAMAYHKKGKHNSFTPEGEQATFLTNGSDPQHGAPFADPTINPDGTPAKEKPKTVKYWVADFQLDVVFNKKGWHFPQQRIAALWGDVKPTLDGKRRPEPLFLRTNGDFIIEYNLTNLIPDYYEMDDFQVRTPTDIVGQHIHLVKFDVLASDGAANGFNYEDGSLSPIEVQKRIAAINCKKGLWAPDLQNQKLLTAKATPFFGKGEEREVEKGKRMFEWLGAQTTVQRWFADPLVNNEGKDRTLRTVFTHDHFGPSTHQQTGLYAGVLVEPPGAIWRSAEDGSVLGEREADPIGPDGKKLKDGGPTSWQALIDYPAEPEVRANPKMRYRDDIKRAHYREFALEFQDTQLAYLKGSRGQPIAYERYDPKSPLLSGWVDSKNAINARSDLPQLVSSGQPGTRSLNYRNEPLPLRLKPDQSNPGQSSPKTDLAHVYHSIARFDEEMNVQPQAGKAINPGSPFRFPEPYPGADCFDPYTPLLRGYENDPIQIRVLVGAHQVGHSFHIQGPPWLTEPSYRNSGYRNTQVMSISEHFEMQFTLPQTEGKAEKGFVDYLYQPSADSSGQLTGLWGLVRAYQQRQKGVEPLPTYSPGKRLTTTNLSRSAPGTFATRKEFLDSVPGRKVRTYQVTATTAAKALAGRPRYQGKLVYHTRYGPIDPNGLLYVYTDDLDAQGRIKPEVPFVLPLVLRANAGDRIEVELRNDLPPVTPAPSLGIKVPGDKGTDPFFYQDLYPHYFLRTSRSVGFHPHLLGYDPLQGNGFNVGQNPVQTVPPGEQKTYVWYAGVLEDQPGGGVKGIPVEFGAALLQPADPLMQHPFGLFAALIVEPEGSTWPERGTEVIVKSAQGKPLFREHVLLFQTEVLIQQPDGTRSPIRPVNYRSEPMEPRFNPSFSAGDSLDLSKNWNAESGLAKATANELVNGNDPETSIVTASLDLPVRLRMLHVAGQGTTPNFTLHGHLWQRQPYRRNSQVIGYNRQSEWTGSTGPLTPCDKTEVVIWHPGGFGKVRGDYLYRDFLSQDFDQGLWGLFRVTDPTTDQVIITQAAFDGKRVHLAGRVSADPVKGQFAPTVTVTMLGVLATQAKVNQDTGMWRAEIATTRQPKRVTVTSAGNGQAVLHATARPQPPQAEFAIPLDQTAAKRQRAPDLYFFRSGQ